MNSFRTHLKITVLLLALGAGAAAGAAPHKKAEKPKEPAAPTAQDFLGDFGKDQGKGKGGNEDLGGAMAGTKEGAAASEDLAPKSELAEMDGAVAMKSVFMARRIMMTSQGCVVPKGTAAVPALEGSGLPLLVSPFSVCAHLESTRGRSVTVTFKILTAKGRAVAKSEETVNFAGRKTLDHVVDFPELPFPAAGRYVYRMEVEGVAVSQVDLLDVKVKATKGAVSADAGPPP